MSPSKSPLRPSPTILTVTREAKTLATFSHPNVAAILGVEDKALVIKFIDSEDFKGPLPLTEAGILHRDLKPANIKIPPDGIVKIANAAASAPTTSFDSPPSPSGPPRPAS